MERVAVRALDPDVIREHRKALGKILVDCVEDGAAVGFVLPYGLREAMDYWDEVASLVEARGMVVLGAWSKARVLVGSVQVRLKMQPDQAHRAIIGRLMVSPSARGAGAGGALLRRAEVEATLHGRTLVTLDIPAGSDAERLCVRHGWRPGGVIPGLSTYPDGTFCDTIFYWKAI
tara:strand:- start:2378 stop:2902 length:525 start_codon:yes stop_codon:yes gene_type:complete